MTVGKGLEEPYRVGYGLKRPLPIQALPPIGSEGTDFPFEKSRPGPRSSPDQPLLPRVAGDWRPGGGAGGGPGAEQANLHPLRLQLLQQPSAQPGAERTSLFGAERRTCPPRSQVLPGFYSHQPRDAVRVEPTIPSPVPSGLGQLSRTLRPGQASQFSKSQSPARSRAQVCEPAGNTPAAPSLHQGAGRAPPLLLFLAGQAGQQGDSSPGFKSTGHLV
ncbi:hypothetical protein LEMLEM_LOCUS22284 [Lemmus lemmus]